MPQEPTYNEPAVESSTVDETVNTTTKQNESIEVEQSEEVQESNSIQRKNLEGIVDEKEPSKFDLSTNNSKALVGVIGLVASLMFPPLATPIFLGTFVSMFAPEITNGIKKVSSGLSEKSTLKALKEKNQKLEAQVKEQAPTQTIEQNENLGPQKTVEIDGAAGRMLETSKNFQSFTQTTNTPLGSPKSQLPKNQGNRPTRVKSSPNIKR